MAARLYDCGNKGKKREPTGSVSEREGTAVSDGPLKSKGLVFSYE
jgi:hypothetical protein